MKPFSSLTQRGQKTRLRRLAQIALPTFGFRTARLTPLNHGFNTTFRIDDAPGIENPDINGGVQPLRAIGETHQDDEALDKCYSPSRYLLRVHRQGWHGGSQRATQSAVESEMMWLKALVNDTDLSVPWPVQASNGSHTVVARYSGVPNGRVCSCLRWMVGRRFSASPKPIYLHRVGEVMAQLHNHAAGWSIPSGFVRTRWTWDALFGDKMPFTTVDADTIWSLVPRPHRSILHKAAMGFDQASTDLGKGSDVWGVIHADLHLDNIIFSGGDARPIDFDDCGFGYWLYDIAVALWELRLDDRWPAFYQAFLDGYGLHRPIPHDQLRFLDSFIAAREAVIGLAVAAETVNVPEYRQYLAEDMKGVADYIQGINARTKSPAL